MTQYALTTEVFCLPYLERYVVYAPLKGLVMVVNAAGANLLAQLHSGALKVVDEENLEILSTWMDLELVNASQEEVHQDGDGLFRPTEATLFLTTACNLRCVYCYASGGDKPRTMGWPSARRAVEFVIENARTLKSDHFSINFHGGGEPTLAWDLMMRVAQYARQRSSEEGLKSRCALATNGVMGTDCLDWITANIDDVTISVDGLHATHDRLRPLRGGGSSFSQVLRTIQTLSGRKRPYGLRMTVTRDNVSEVPDAVAFFCEHSSPHTIHVEPVFRCGRCATDNVAGPEAGQFLAVYRAAREIADRHGVRLYYSAARYPDVTVIFCQAAGRSFAVTSEGGVTSCYEVCDPNDPRAGSFFFGHYDSAQDRFIFDDQKLKRLRSLTVNNLSFCRDCFCKYHCAGDCPAKRLAMFEGGMPDAESSRCRITQELTKDQIISALQKGTKAIQVVAREHALLEEAHRG